ncbi:MAG: hypothetical protein ABJC07_00495 [Acidobacteriota bacterium]
MITGGFASALLASLITLSFPGGQAAHFTPTRASNRPPAMAVSSAPARTPAVRARAHGISLSGRVSGLDPVKKTLSVRDGAGRETSLVWTGATKISGGELKIGESVTLRYLDKDTRHIATTIRISPPPAAARPGAGPAAAVMPSPTP